jgi:hypothetical protein
MLFERLFRRQEAKLQPETDLPLSCRIRRPGFNIIKNFFPQPLMLRESKLERLLLTKNFPQNVKMGCIIKIL